MKKILAMVLALCLLSACALSEEIVVYKSDKFLIQFPNDWAEVPIENSKTYSKVTDGKYDMSKGYMVLEEISDSNASKGKELLENSYLNSYMKECESNGLEIIAKDSITVNNSEKTIVLLEADNLAKDKQYIYLSFVAGNGSLLMILYGSTSYRIAKIGLQEILESIIVR